jgi:phosphatidylglycerol:prolipoprotein diacylglycerol transferase
MQPHHWYTAFMLLALAVFLVARHYTPKPPELAALPFSHRLALGLAAFVGGALGAKLPFLFAEPLDWSDAESWLRAVFRDGKTVVAGLGGAYLAVEAIKKILDIRVKTGDTFALPLALAMAVGRWGCFFNGCCYGTPTSLPWAVSFRQKNGAWLRCHPTQIYESLFHLAMACVLLEVMHRGALKRQRLKLYLICYGVFRFLTEFIRPEEPWLLGLTAYQWGAMCLVIGLSLQWQMDRRGLEEELTTEAQRHREAKLEMAKKTLLLLLSVSLCLCG